MDRFCPSTCLRLQLGFLRPDLMVTLLRRTGDISEGSRVSQTAKTNTERRTERFHTFYCLMLREQSIQGRLRFCGRCETNRKRRNPNNGLSPLYDAQARVIRISKASWTSARSLSMTATRRA